MFIVSALQGAFGLVRVALASILLVWVPIADAAICAGDDTPSSIQYTFSADQIGADQTASDASSSVPDGASFPLNVPHCVHGHCHHPAAPQSSQEVAIVTLDGATAAPRESIVLVSYVTAGMERPPKA